MPTRAAVSSIRGEQGYVVRGIGLIRSLQDLGNIVILAKNGTPVFLKNLGTLQLGALERRGILGKDNNPDGVSGIVLLLRGMNPSQVLEGVHAQVAALNRRLSSARCKAGTLLRSHRTRPDDRPPGVDRLCSKAWASSCWSSSVSWQRTRRAHGRLDCSFPLLFAFICMRFTHIPANLLSLGAIDFGIIVDASIVVMENILRRREEHPEEKLSEAGCAGIRGSRSHAPFSSQR